MALAFLLTNFFHIVFLAWGLGGATVAVLIALRGEKEPALMPSAMKLVEPISKLIWIAIIGLAVTGIIMSAMGYGKGYFDENILAVKHIAVIALVINGLIITLKLLPKLKKLAPAPASKPAPEFFKARKQMQLGSAISLFLWYLITAISVAM